MYTRSFVSAGGGLNLAEIGSPSNLFSFSHTRNSSRMELSRLDTLRSASSAGTPPEMWFREVSSTEQDPEQDAGVGSHPRMGIGLPLSNIFAT
jgi:pyruvate dehydrogenase kinase 2/3/4